MVAEGVHCYFVLFVPFGKCAEDSVKSQFEEPLLSVQEL